MQDINVSLYSSKQIFNPRSKEQWGEFRDGSYQYNEMDINPISRSEGGTWHTIFITHFPSHTFHHTFSIRVQSGTNCVDCAAGMLGDLSLNQAFK